MILLRTDRKMGGFRCKLGAQGATIEETMHIPVGVAEP